MYFGMMKLATICFICASGLKIQDAEEENNNLIPKEIIEQYESQMLEQEARLIRTANPDYVPPDMGTFTVSKSPKKTGKAQQSKAMPMSTSSPNNRFAEIQIELPLKPPLIHHKPVEGGLPEKGPFGGKNLVGLDQMKNGGCVVYSMGVSGNSVFEEDMARKIGCEVHAFDCTINEETPSVKGKHFNFHKWCIGTSENVSLTGGRFETANTQFKFKTLADSMKELGHSSMDVLKFDIEGFEWQLFENELLKGHVLPKQLSFEMHTEGAKPWAVPKDNTQGRTNRDVNNVFLRLHKLGYRVVSKELNHHDHACAEFVLVRV